MSLTEAIKVKDQRVNVELNSNTRLVPVTYVDSVQHKAYAIRAAWLRTWRITVICLFANGSANLEEFP